MDRLFIFVIYFVILILCIVIGVASHSRRARLGVGQKVKVQFTNPNTGRTVHAGYGNSVGSAVSDGLYKVYSSLSASSRLDTIQTKLRAMESLLSENRYRMTPSDISQCERYIGQTRVLLAGKEEEARKKAEAQREKERGQSQQRRFVAQQRRLMTDSLRYDVLKRDNFRCQLCGATAQDGVKLHVDHIFPVSKGGKTEMSNLRTLCERCNMGKRDKVEEPVKAEKIENTEKLEKVEKKGTKNRKTSPEILFTDMNGVMSALRALGIEFEIVKIYDWYAIKSTPEVDSILQNASLETGRLHKSNYYDEEIWSA